MTNQEVTNAMIKPRCDDNACAGNNGECTEVFLARLKIQACALADL